MKNPAITVIVPVYNTEQYLPGCIDSILAQTFTDFELLLVDDGSKDSSGAICDEYAVQDKRVRVFHKANGGASSARNEGLSHAHGDWIMYVDGDDWIERTYIEELYEAADKNKADIAICGFRFVDDEGGGESTEKYPTPWNNDKQNSLSMYMSKSWTTAVASIQRRSLYTTNNIKFPEEIVYCEDFHLMVRLCFFASKVVSIARILYNYRQQQNSVMHTQNKNRQRDELNVYTEIIKFFKNNGQYEKYKKVLAWGTLRVSQDLVLDTSRFDEFKKYNPDKKDFVRTCPFIGRKIKVLAWLITHDLEIFARTALRFRQSFIR